MPDPMPQKPSLRFSLLIKIGHYLKLVKNQLHDLANQVIEGWAINILQKHILLIHYEETKEVNQNLREFMSENEQHKTKVL